jgi:hypothetical protein
VSSWKGINVSQRRRGSSQCQRSRRALGLPRWCPCGACGDGAILMLLALNRHERVLMSSTYRIMYVLAACRLVWCHTLKIGLTNGPLDLTPSSIWRRWQVRVNALAARGWPGRSGFVGVPVQRCGVGCVMQQLVLGCTLQCRFVAPVLQGYTNRVPSFQCHRDYRYIALIRIMLAVEVAVAGGGHLGSRTRACATQRR